MLTSGRIIFRRISLKRFYSAQNLSQNEVPPEAKSIDRENMKLLNDYSKQWWDTNGQLRTLHSMNSVRVPFIRDGLIGTGIVSPDKEGSPRVLEGLSLLEIGCGGGILTEALGTLCATVTGLEPAKELCEVASQHVALNPELASRITYTSETIEDFVQNPINQSAFDAVILSEVIEHVNEPDTFLNHCLAPLKPGGSIFLTTFNRTTTSWLTGIVIAEHLTNLVPKGTHDWDKFITPDEMQCLLEGKNCTVILTNGLFYTPWNNSWRAIANLDVSYAMQAVKN